MELIIKLGAEVEETQEQQRKRKQDSVAETIENNVRKVIIEESPTNPKYFDKMSKLLDELIKQRKAETLAYQEYLIQITELAKNVTQTGTSNSYPSSLRTPAQRALYDNLGQDEHLSLVLDEAIQYTKNAGWRDGGIREKKVRLAVLDVLRDEKKTDEMMKIIKAQSEY